MCGFSLVWQLSVQIFGRGGGFGVSDTASSTLRTLGCALALNQVCDTVTLVFFFPQIDTFLYCKGWVNRRTEWQIPCEVTILHCGSWKYQVPFSSERLFQCLQLLMNSLVKRSFEFRPTTMCKQSIVHSFPYRGLLKHAQQNGSVELWTPFIQSNPNSFSCLEWNMYHPNYCWAEWKCSFLSPSLATEICSQAVTFEFSSGLNIMERAKGLVAWQERKRTPFFSSGLHHAKGFILYLVKAAIGYTVKSGYNSHQGGLAWSISFEPVMLALN